MLLHSELPLAIVLAGWALLLPFAALALAAVRRQFLLAEVQQHLWLAGALLMAWLWSAQIGAAGGPRFAMLGVALYALLFGRARAILGLLLALALHTAAFGGSWADFGVNGLLIAVGPVWLATGLQRQLARWLPKNLFIFMIGNGMFVVLVVTAATSLALLAAGWAAAPGAVPDFESLIVYALLLAWGEALASGMIFTALVVYVPQAVLTYRQDVYLPPHQAMR
ncbi:MAG: energy-coupling factor ABC transporter permease [Betaproteobacteria bacterium]